MRKELTLEAVRAGPYGFTYKEYTEVMEEAAGVAVTMRVSHGGNIKAACGQLANQYNNKKLQEANYENHYNQSRVR